MSRDVDRRALERLLGVPEMAWLLERVRARVPAAGDQPLSGVVRLDAPSAEQRAAAVRLVGRPKRVGSSLRIDLADVEEMLRRGPWSAGLADAIVTLTGPVVDRGADRAREADAWDRARRRFAPAAARFPGLLPWWDGWCATGGLKRAARSEAARTGVTPGPDVADDLVRRVAAVLDALPASGPPLAVFAHQVLGDAHGLDDSRPLGRVAAAVVGVAFVPAGSAVAPSTREAWASAGVVMSNLSSTVLSLGVAGSRGPDRRTTATATALVAMREARMPMLLTLDQVRSGGVRPVPAGGQVYACENPAVVEVVAARWWALPSGREPASDPVLVCISGQPSTAVVELLELLTAEGAGCRYHGDFDWAGIRIARALASRIPWMPWRYTAAEYLSAADADTSSLDLAGSPLEAPWDPALSAAMVATGRAIEEEAVADILAADVLTTG